VRVERERDISDDVLLSCDEIAQRRVQTFDSRNEPQLLQNFLAVPGSRAYEDMKARRWPDKVLKLRKDGGD
jgi:hypothetical protein